MKKFYRYPMFLLLTIALLALILFYLIHYAKQPALSEKDFPSSKVLNFAPTTPSHPKQLRVVSYNMGYAFGEKNNQGAVLSQKEVEKNLTAMANALKAFQADLIFLQEVDFEAARSFNINQLEFLAQQLDFPEAAYTITWNKRYIAWPYWPPSAHFGKMLSGQAVLSRLPIVSQEIKNLPKPSQNPFWYNWFYLERIVQKITLKLGEQKLSVYNLHLEAFSASARSQQLKLLAQWIQEDPTPLKIVAGDFNLNWQSLSENQKDQAELKNFAKQTQLTLAGEEKTYFSFSSWKPEERIDLIYFSKGFELNNDGNIEKLTASDHLPVWAELHW